MGVGAAALTIPGCMKAGSLFGKGATAKPNVILILLDDMGWSDLSCYGNACYETPNIDR